VVEQEAMEVIQLLLVRLLQKTLQAQEPIL
jgi:hypothetical protein